MAAAARLEGVVTRTPLLPIDPARGGDGGWLKAESLQRGGAFKLRGAYNRLSLIAAADRPRGVVAFSSGNHAQGVALAARLLGHAGDDRDAGRCAGGEAGGDARAGRRGGALRSRDARAARRSRRALAAARGAVLVPSFDDPLIVEGQGTRGAGGGGADGGADQPRDRAVRRRRAGGGDRAGAAGCRDHRRRARGLGRYADDRWRRARSSRCAADAPPTACDALQTRRVADLTFGVLHARRRARRGGERGGDARRDAATPSRWGWWSSRAGRWRWRRCLPAGWRRMRARWWWSRAAMSIRWRSRR